MFLNVCPGPVNVPVFEKGFILSPSSLNIYCSFWKFHHYWSSIDSTSGSSPLLMFWKSRIFICARVKMDSRKMVANGLQHVEHCQCSEKELSYFYPFIQEYVFSVIHSSDLKVSSCLILDAKLLAIIYKRKKNF